MSGGGWADICEARLQQTCETWLVWNGDLFNLFSAPQLLVFYTYSPDMNKANNLNTRLKLYHLFSIILEMFKMYTRPERRSF